MRQAEIVSNLMKQASASGANAGWEFQSPVVIFEIFQNLDHHLIRYKLKEFLIVLVDNFEVCKHSVRETDHLGWLLCLFTSRLLRFHVRLDLFDWLKATHHLFLIDHVTNRR